MIGSVRGKISYKNEKMCLVEAGAIGYVINATEETLERQKEGGEVFFWTHHVVREDSDDLYGFESRGEIEMFQMLLSVSGIGPKTALGVLSHASPESLRKAVSSSDGSRLNKIFGISKKIADKIVLELRGKMASNEMDSKEFLKEEVDALEALKSLGYGHKEAREALQSVPKDLTSMHDRIKEALKILGK